MVVVNEVTGGVDNLGLLRLLTDICGVYILRKHSLHDERRLRIVLNLERGLRYVISIQFPPGPAPAVESW